MISTRTVAQESNLGHFGVTIERIQQTFFERIDYHRNLMQTIPFFRSCLDDAPVGLQRNPNASPTDAV